MSIAADGTSKMGSEINSEVNIKKRAGRGESFGRRFLKKLFPLILLSIAAPFTVCVYGPFDIYSANLSEFLFSLNDFLPYTFIFAFAAAAVIFLSLAFLEGLAFDIGCATVTWLSLMLFVQRSYLNMFIDGAFLAGDGNNSLEFSIGAIILNSLIWILAGAAIITATVLLRKKITELVSTAATIAMIALIGMQAVTFGITSLTTDAFVSVVERQEGQEILTYDNIEQLSSGKNIVFFLVDRFDANYYEAMVKNDPAFFDRLDGFTHFNDYTSLYARTYPAVASILTGKDHDFTQNKDAAFESFYEDGGMMGVLKNNGYNINLYTEKGYAYNDASVMEGYADNRLGLLEYSIDNNLTLARDMVLLSLSQYLPIAARGWSGYMSTPTFNNHAQYKSNDSEMFMVNESSTEDLKGRLESDKMCSVETKGQFTFIHLYGCHDTKKSSNENIRNTFDLIYYYLDQMKEMGLYEDATIIITGDHAAALSDSKMIGSASKNDDGTRVTAMLFKKSGDSGTPLAESSAQISQDELWNTIFESEGLNSEKNGDSFFDISEGEDRERRYIFEMYKNSKNNDLKYNRLYEYKITGNANLGENWEIVKETDVIK